MYVYVWIYLESIRNTDYENELLYMEVYNSTHYIYYLFCFFGQTKPEIAVFLPGGRGCLVFPWKLGDGYRKIGMFANDLRLALNIDIFWYLRYIMWLYFSIWLNMFKLYLSMIATNENMFRCTNIFFWGDI